MSLRGKAIEAEKVYKVAGWAPVAEAARDVGGEPIWDLMSRYLKAIKTVKARQLNLPVIKGVTGNPGIAS